jgi:endonuclease/exonuclease/phosphatase family metal-dependent hydrolase
MKRILLFVLAVLVAFPQFATAQKKESEGLKVMSYNIRYGSADDGTNSWKYRWPATVEMLNDVKPDVVGVQEALDLQVEFISEMVRDYKGYGVGREDGKHDGEHMAIFWNKKTIKMIKSGTFWLSETPEKPSMGWDAACYRTATWALMKDKKTGKKFYFVNTHLDHEGREAQKNGLKLIVDRIASINPEGYPMVLTGDFNITPDNPGLVDLDKIMTSTRKIAKKTDNKGTFNGWRTDRPGPVIDYIYMSGFSSVPVYETITKKYADKPFISDHNPIMSVLVF